jgi:hypothetical protein
MRGGVDFEIVPAAGAAEFYFFDQMVAGAAAGLRSRWQAGSSKQENAGNGKRKAADNVFL